MCFSLDEMNATTKTTRETSSEKNKCVYGGIGLLSGRKCPKIAMRTKFCFRFGVSYFIDVKQAFGMWKRFRAI